MLARKLLSLLSIAGLAFPVLVFAQAHDASIANHQPHYYDAADFDIDSANVNYADHIAPILQRSCQSCHRPGGGGPMSLLTSGSSMGPSHHVSNCYSRPHGSHASILC